jgi:hypothetical protein
MKIKPGRRGQQIITSQSDDIASLDQLEYYQEFQLRNPSLARAFLLGGLMSMLYVQIWVP